MPLLLIVLLLAAFLLVRRREPPNWQLVTGPVVAAATLLVARWSGRSWTEIGLTFGVPSTPCSGTRSRRS